MVVVLGEQREEEASLQILPWLEYRKDQQRLVAMFQCRVFVVAIVVLHQEKLL